jgi:hypothetical protein
MKGLVTEHTRLLSIWLIDSRKRPSPGEGLSYGCAEAPKRAREKSKEAMWVTSLVVAPEA